MARYDGIKKALETAKLLEALREIAGTEEELHALIEDIIEHRERLRDEELARLEHEAATLLARLKKNREASLIAEIACFKDVLRLHQARRGNGSE